VEEKIGGRFGWSREKIKNHVTLRSKIGAEILVFAKTFQRDLAPKNGAFAPKNERGVTSGLSGVIWKPFPDTLLPNAATVNLFRPVTKMVISISETSTFARQAAYTPPWEEIVPLYVYLPSQQITNAHKGDKRVVFRNPHCRLIMDDSYHKKCNRSTEVLHRTDK